MKEDKSVLLRIAADTKGIRGRIALSALFGMAAVLCNAAAPEILGQLVDLLCAFGQGDRSGSIRGELLPGMAMLAAVYVGYCICGYFRVFVMNRAVSRHFTLGFRVAISRKLERLGVSYMDQTPVGEILKRVTGDVGEMGGYLHQVFDTLIDGGFQLTVVTIAMLRENWVLAIFVLILTPASIFLSSKMAEVCGKYFDTMFEVSEEMTELVEESFTNFATARAYNLEQELAEKHGEVDARLCSHTAKANYYSSVIQPIIRFTNALAYICINLVGGWLVVRCGVSVGTVVTIVLFARQFASPLEQIANGFGNLSHVKSCAKRVYEVLDLEEEPRPGKKLSCTPRGKVEFRDVCFSYRREEPLIRDLNLQVSPGQKVAIVGPTGAGKTTIVNLLMRFYDLDSGTILLDGEDLSTLSREEVRRQFGMVLQDTWLFRGTIAQNVAYGKPGATMEEIRQACRQTDCDHFIRTMPDGYDTVISEDTGNLSGGQKQLLTIARALLADRPLLILDEATSNVDTRTEILIQKAMDKLMAGKTCFVIAHRLSTIVDADRILVLNDGQIVEQGTHQELLAREGFYYRLFTSQYAL